MWVRIENEAKFAVTPSVGVLLDFTGLITVEMHHYSLWKGPLKHEGNILKCNLN